MSMARVLVNNAGTILVGPASAMARADFERGMATHVWGPLDAIAAVLRHLRAVGGGRIVNISSVGGKIAVPHLLPYCASKFALTGFRRTTATAVRTSASRASRQSCLPVLTTLTREAEKRNDETDHRRALGA